MFDGEVDMDFFLKQATKKGGKVFDGIYTFITEILKTKVLRVETVGYLKINYPEKTDGGSRLAA